MQMAFSDRRPISYCECLDYFNSPNWLSAGAIANTASATSRSLPSHTWLDNIKFGVPVGHTSSP